MKVLDFGLAKALDPSPDADPSQSPTLTAAATQMGVIMGTAAYMSPEQARGKPVDKRTDIWAFGCVLLEMLSGQQAFPGDLTSEVLAAVIRAEPAWDGFPARTNPNLRIVLERCLEKELRSRWQDIGDVRTDLERIARDPTGAQLPTRTADVSSSHRSVPWVIAAGLAAGVIWLLAQPPSVARDEITAATVEIVLPEGVYLPVESKHATLALSPEGTRLIFAGVRNGVRRLYRRDLDDPDFVVVEIEGTEGADSPFFSPDGSQVAFFAESRLRTVSPDSGVPTDIGRTTPSGVHRGGAWIDDETFVHARSANDPISVLRSTSDHSLLPVDAWTPIDQLPAPSSWPAAVGERGLLFTDRSGEPGTDSVGLFSFDTLQVTSLVNGGSYPRYSPTGHVLYARSGSLYAIEYDTEGGDTGNERLLIEGIEMGDAGQAQFAVADNGTLAYVAGDLTVAEHELVWVDRDGNVVDSIRDDEQPFVSPRLSPDESQVAFNRDTGANTDVFVVNLIRGDLTRWTFDPGEDFAPVWHPDGGLALATEIGEGSGEQGPALGWMEGSNDDTELLFERPGDGNWEFPVSFSPDGQWLAYSAFGTDGNRDLYLLDFAMRTADPFVVTPSFIESTPMFSPDGVWIAYVSDRPGREDVWIAPSPLGSDSQPVSTAGGTEPVWSKDGSELFYREGTRMMRVTFSNGPGMPDTPQLLFADSFEPALPGPGIPNYDVSSDGTRFVMVRRKNPVRPTVIRVVLNWPEVFGLDDD